MRRIKAHQATIASEESLQPGGDLIALVEGFALVAPDGDGAPLALPRERQRDLRPLRGREQQRARRQARFEQRQARQFALREKAASFAHQHPAPIVLKAGDRQLRALELDAARRFQGVVVQGGDVGTGAHRRRSRSR